MIKFSDLNINIDEPAFSGEKISVKKILNKQIVVHKYKITKSKFEGKGDCLHLQVEVDGVPRVIFTSGTILIKQLQQVPDDKFPITTQIEFKNERYEFV